MHRHAYTCICMHIHAYACMYMHRHANTCIEMQIHAYKSNPETAPFCEPQYLHPVARIGPSLRGLSKCGPTLWGGHEGWGLGHIYIYIYDSCFLFLCPPLVLIIAIPGNLPGTFPDLPGLRLFDTPGNGGRNGP